MKSKNRNSFFLPSLFFALAILTLTLSFAMVWIASPILIEKFYSLGFYKTSASFFSNIFGIFPFSVAETFAVLICISVIIAVIVIAVRILKFLITLSKTKRFYCKKAVVKTATFISVALFIASSLFFQFRAIWALNHYRIPISKTIGLEIKERSTEDLLSLCFWLSTNAAKLRSELSEDQSGIAQLGSVQEILQRAPTAMASLSQFGPAFDAPLPRPKPVFFSRMLSYSGVSGIYIPFTFEANLNVEQPDLLLPVSGCHELAHILGFAREDEANFIAFLACYESNRQDENPEFAYSAFMLALFEADHLLYNIDPDAYKQLLNSYSPEMNSDLADYSDYWVQFEGSTQDAMTEVNDSYLKLHDQLDGIKSYGRMIDLLLAAYDAGWFN